MAQQLRTLVSLAEDKVWFLPPFWWLTTSCNSRSREPDALFCPLKGLSAYDAQTSMQANTHTKKI